MQDIKKTIESLTLKEKSLLCSGADYWHTKEFKNKGIDSVTVSDGPHGLRLENDEDTDNIALKASHPATCFPTAACTACSWDTDLLNKIGRAIADEAKEQGVCTVLGPGVNLKRSPLGGRNFEYFSEDPVLSAKLGAAYINGVESEGIGTSLKHYAANSQEYFRMSINEVIDERTLRETYLRVFEDILAEAQPASVMSAYERINGEYCSDSKYLLTDMLRDKFGFKGIVVSDWGATNDRVVGLKAGLDLEMPFFGGHNDKAIEKAVEKETLDVEVLDKTVERLLTWSNKYGETIKHATASNYRAHYEANHELAMEAAAESIVLLKNEDNVFPFKKNEQLTVFGKIGKIFRHQGSGSSRVNAKNLVSFNDYLDEEKIDYVYADGYKLEDTIEDVSYSEELIKEAVELAKGKEKVLIFVGLTDNFETESLDKQSYTIPKGHVALIEAVSEVCKNVAVVILGGSSMEMPWLDKVKGVMHAYLPGEAGGQAIGKLVFGEKCPSGKLAETFPYSEKDCLAQKYFGGGPATVEYRDGIFVGYKYYEAAKKNVLFPFGYGLSYTSFEYDDVSLSSDKITEGDALTLSFTLKNTGKFDGAEICEVYCKDVESTVFRPEKELCAFKKVFLKAGESTQVTIDIPKKAFAFFNTAIDDWYVESGEFEILLGKSSRDIVSVQKVFVTSAKENADIPDYVHSCPVYYDLEGVEEIPTEQFTSLYGKDLPENKFTRRGQFNMASTIRDLKKKTLIGNIFALIAPVAMSSQIKHADATTMLAMNNTLKEIPIRALCGMSGGIVSYELALAIIRLANLRIISGSFLIFVGLIKTFSTLARKAKEDKERSKAAKQKKMDREAETAIQNQ